MRLISVFKRKLNKYVHGGKKGMKLRFLFIMQVQDEYMFACKKGVKLCFLFILQENVFTSEKGI